MQLREYSIHYYTKCTLTHRPCDTLIVPLIAQIIGVSVLFDLRICFKCNHAFLESKLILGVIVYNQQKWRTLSLERTGVGGRLGELPEDSVVQSSSFYRLGLHFPSTSQYIFSPIPEHV